MHSSFDTMRHIPIRYETDLWRPRYEMTRFPTTEFPPFPTSPMNTSEVSRYSSNEGSRFPPATLPPPEFNRSLVHYPDVNRQMSQFDGEIRRMNDEMGRMFNNMQKLTPSGTVDDWRLSENFRLDNPITTDLDGNRKFKLQFDVRQFKPEEINVRTAGNTLTVMAKHESKDNGKSVSREYNRQYVIPKEVTPDRLVSKLSTDGVLTIEAPLPALEGPREKILTIEHRK